MQSDHLISQAEAERLHQMPKQEHASRLQVTARSTAITMGSGQYRIVEPATVDIDVHSLLGTAEGTKKAKGLIKRKHVALVLDTDTNLLLPLVPAVENGAAKPDTYRMLNYELVKAAYSPISKERINKALDEQNVEVHAGCARRFIMPSVCLLPKNVDAVRRPRSASAASSSKSAASALGSSASRVAAASIKSKAPTVDAALVMAGKLQDQRIAEVLLACQTILQACRDDRPDQVPGLMLGPIDATGSDESTLPPDYLLSGIDKVPLNPTAHQQQMDLLNRVAVGSQLQFVNKYTVSADDDNGDTDDTDNAAAAGFQDPAKNSDVAAKSAIADRAVSTVSELSSISAADQQQQQIMPAGKSTVKSSSSSSSAKRKADDEEIVEVVATGKRVADAHASSSSSSASRDRTADDLVHVVRAAMPVFTTGILSPVVHGAVMPEGTSVQRSWHAGAGNQQEQLPPAIVSGMQLSDVFHDTNAERHATVMGHIKNLRDKGVNGMSESDRDAFSSATVARMLSDRVPVGKKSTYTNLIMGSLGLQFLGGALHGWLSADIDAQIKQVVEKVIMPLVDEGNAARAATAKAETAAVEAKTDAAKAVAAMAEATGGSKAELADITAQKVALEATIEELQAQASSQADELAELKAEMAKLKGKGGEGGLQTASDW